MRGPALAMVVLAFAAAAAPRPLAGQSAAPEEQLAVPRTPWGDTDLQGLWNYATNTPLQRPPEYAGREWLTEEEVAAANLESQTFATSERRSELTPLFDLSLNYNQFWWDLGVSTGRTSLITDPADGRLPPRTPERQAYEATPEAQRLQAARWGLGPAAGPEDMEPNDRCIVDRQVPVASGGDNDHVRILQSPGYVVILQEKIHDFRIVPVTGGPDLPAGVRQWLGVSRGRWEGETLVVETTNFHAQADYLGSGPGPPRGRAVHPAGRERHRVHLHGDRPERLDAAVDRNGAVARGRGAAVRVRLPRGELQHDERPRGVAGGRCAPVTTIARASLRALRGEREALTPWTRPPIVRILRSDRTICTIRVRQDAALPESGPAPPPPFSTRQEVRYRRGRGRFRRVPARALSRAVRWPRG